MTSSQCIITKQFLSIQVNDDKKVHRAKEQKTPNKSQQKIHSLYADTFCNNYILLEVTVKSCNVSNVRCFLSLFSQGITQIPLNRVRSDKSLAKPVIY